MYLFLVVFDSCCRRGVIAASRRSFLQIDTWYLVPGTWYQVPGMDELLQGRFLKVLPPPLSLMMWYNKVATDQDRHYKKRSTSRDYDDSKMPNLFGAAYYDTHLLPSRVKYGGLASTLLPPGTDALSYPSIFSCPSFSRLHLYPSMSEKWERRFCFSTTKIENGHLWVFPQHKHGIQVPVVLFLPTSIF